MKTWGSGYTAPHILSLGSSHFTHMERATWSNIVLKKALWYENYVQNTKKLRDIFHYLNV